MTLGWVPAASPHCPKPGGTCLFSAQGQWGGERKGWKDPARIWGGRLDVGLGCACRLRSRTQRERRSAAIHLLAGCFLPLCYLPTAFSSVSYCSEQHRWVPRQHLGWERWKMGRKGADCDCAAVLPSARCRCRLLHRTTGRIWVATLGLQGMFCCSISSGLENNPDLLSASLMGSGVAGDGWEGQSLHSSPTSTSRGHSGAIGGFEGQNLASFGSFCRKRLVPDSILSGFSLQRQERSGELTVCISVMLHHLIQVI